MNSILDELFLDEGNIFELRNTSKHMHNFSIDENNINITNIKKFTSTKEYISMTTAVGEFNVLYILDLVNKKFLESIKKNYNAVNKNTNKLLSNYYNPYGGFIDTELTINDEISTTNFDNRGFLDRNKKNKTVLAKCMNSRLTDKLENDDDSILENNYYFSKRLKINID
jgi:hypothetical protein